MESQTTFKPLFAVSNLKFINRDILIKLRLEQWNKMHLFFYQFCCPVQSEKKNWMKNISWTAKITAESN